MREHQVRATDVEQMTVTLSESGARTVNDRHMPDINLQYMLALVHSRLGHADRARGYLRDCAGMSNNQDYAELCQASLGDADPAVPARDLGEAAPAPGSG